MPDLRSVGLSSRAAGGYEKKTRHEKDALLPVYG